MDGVKMNPEIIEIQSANELPAGVEFILYEPPFQGDELQDIVSSFTRKYGHEPQTIYKLDKQWFVVKREAEYELS
jgi:hypothetical protein